LSKEVLKIRTRAYILGIIASVLYALSMSFATIFSPGWQPWTAFHGASRLEELVDTLPYLFFVPLVTSLLVAAINKKDREFLTKAETLIIISMVWIPLWVPTYWGMFVNFTVAYTARVSATWYPYYQRFYSDLMYLFGPAPWDDLAKWQGFLYGGPINWADWGTPLLFFMAWCIPYWLMSIFMAGILRRQFIEIENLEFPMAGALTRLVNMAYERTNGRPQIFKNKYLWIGILLSLLSTAPTWIYAIVPQWVRLRPWITPGNPGAAKVALTWGWDFNPLALLPWVPVQICLDLPIIGVALLIPSTTLLTFIIFRFIHFWILPPIFVAMGLWDPMPVGEINAGSYIYSMIAEGLGPITNTGGWRDWFGGIYAWFSDGAVAALLFVPILVTYRSDFIRRIKAIFKPNPEIEATQPAKYRYLWLGFIVCWLINGLAFWYGTGFVAPYWWCLISILLPFIWWPVFVSRITAEVGDAVTIRGDNPGHYIEGAFSYWWIAPDGPFTLPQKERFMAIRGNLQYSWIARASPLASSLEMYSASRSIGVPSKHIFIAGLLSLIIVTLVATPSFLAFAHMIGVENAKPYLAAHSVETGPMRYPFYICQDAPEYKAGTAPMPGQWIAFALGALEVMAIMALRARVPGFPFNAAGVAVSWWNIAQSFFIPAIVGYIIRVVVIKIGGQKMYEGALIPLAIGLISGFTIIVAIAPFTVAYAYFNKL